MRVCDGISSRRKWLEFSQINLTHLAANYIVYFHFSRATNQIPINFLSRKQLVYFCSCINSIRSDKHTGGSCTLEVKFEFIHHLIFVGSHHWLSFRRWLFSHCSFTYHLHISRNNEKLGWPLLERKSAVASAETQVMNSNSISVILETHTHWMPLAMSFVAGVPCWNNPSIH